MRFGSDLSESRATRPQVFAAVRTGKVITLRFSKDTRPNLGQVTNGV